MEDVQALDLPNLPRRYGVSLIDRLQRGLFTCELGLQVAERREADRRHEALLRATPPTPEVGAGGSLNSLPQPIREVLERMRPKAIKPPESAWQADDR